MRAVYRVFAVLIAVAVVLQVASIALAGFTVAKDADDGTTIGADYSNFGQSYHSIAGTAIALLALILLIVSFLTDVPRGRTLAGIIVGLVAVQFVLAVAAFGVPALGVLHGINGLAIAGVAGAASRRAAAVPEQANV
jgi:choline-glycine betaine transporter